MTPSRRGLAQIFRVGPTRPPPLERCRCGGGVGFVAISLLMRPLGHWRRSCPGPFAIVVVAAAAVFNLTLEQGAVLGAASFFKSSHCQRSRARLGRLSQRRSSKVLREGTVL